MHTIARPNPAGALPLILVACGLLATATCNKKSEPPPSTTVPSGSGGDGARVTPETGQVVIGSGGNGAGAPAGPACGARTCAAGEVCCNASCGICTPPDGVCTQQLCEAPAADGGSATSGAACKEDGDCRLFSDYCTGCDCRALRKADKDPPCSGPGVRCLADPCQNHTAVCRDGKCQAAVPKTPRNR